MGLKRKLIVYGSGAAALLLFSVVCSLSVGSAHVPVPDVWRILLDRLPVFDRWITADWAPESETIVMDVRLSRVLLAVLVGSALAAAGAGFQGVLRNPLADPYTLGVASGSSAGAALVILFGWQSVIGQWTIPLVAFATGMATLLIVFVLARTPEQSGAHTLILAGIIIQAFLGAFVSFLVSLANNTTNEIVFWLMGSLSMRGWDVTNVLLPYVLIGVLLLFRFGRTLNLFAFGEREAAHLGVAAERTKWVVLMLSSLLTAAAVSVSGVIGFVGLVVPHLVRLMIGPDYRLLIPVSTIAGGIYVVWADTIARTALSPREIPLGIVTALFGAPFFVYLLRRRRNRLGEGR